MTRLKPLLLILLLVLIGWHISNDNDQDAYVDRLLNEVADKDGEVLTLKSNLKLELDMRDTQLETLKNKVLLDEQNRANDKIVLDYIVAEQARINKRQDELTGVVK